MSIFDRMGRIIAGNLNALLDRFEDEKKLLELNLDEADEQIKKARQDALSAVADAKQLQKKRDDCDAEMLKWEQRAELALKAGDEALAREALKQKQRLSEERDSLEKARATQVDTARTMAAEIARMEARVKELRLTKGTLAARIQHGRAGGSAEALGRSGGGGENPFSEFRRFEDRIDGREAEAQALTEVEQSLTGEASKEELEAKFRKLEGSGGGVEGELDALKRRLRVDVKK